MTQHDARIEVDAGPLRDAISVARRRLGEVGYAELLDRICADISGGRGEDWHLTRSEGGRIICEPGPMLLDAILPSDLVAFDLSVIRGAR